MTAAHEAVTLPAIFLTVVLLGGIHPGQAIGIAAPSLFSLVLAMLLFGALVQSGTLAPAKLMDASRPALANTNGLVVIVSAFLASAQALSLVMPASGLPAAIVGCVLLAMLLQMLATSPDRSRLLRGLMVIFGAAFTLKFIVLAALSAPADGRVARALQVLFDNVTLGAIAQAPLAPIEGYLAFFTLVLYLVGLWLLPSAGWNNQKVDALIVASSDLTKR